MSERVLVTGASCFLAQTLIQRLHQAGFQVRIAVETDEEASRLRALFLSAELSSDALSYALVRPTLQGGWVEALDGCSYLCHSLIPDRLILDMGSDGYTVHLRDNALRLLNAARNEIAMKRVVVVGSTRGATGRGELSSRRVYTEADWSRAAPPPDGRTDMTRSLSFAERAMWDYVRADGSGLELTTLLCGYTLGPFLADQAPERLKPIAKLMRGGYPGLPRIGFIMTDARDLAEAQLRSLTAPQAAGQRYIVADRFFWLSEIAGVLRAAYPDRRESISTLALPDLLVKAIAWLHPEFQIAAGTLGLERHVSNEKLVRDLGVTPRPGSQTLIDAAKRLIEIGALD